jgi:hypothetical protein
MLSEYKKMIILTGLLLFLFIRQNIAGPPFITDDPEPVQFKHWEYYISSINTFQPTIWQGTSPHFEINYGLIPNVQVHLLLPVNYSYVQSQRPVFGYADSEFGIKFRFIQESDNMPQVGTFPIIEIPTVRNSEFSNGKAQIYIPLWLQKSWGKLSTYGGAGYWINPGTNNKNWVFTGWEIQYDVSQLLTLGGELYYHSADAITDKDVTAFNLGGFINFSEKFHLIFSFGHSLINDNFISSYLGLLWTI